MFSIINCEIPISETHMSAIVRVESAGNPYAVGVVGHYLSRQPTSEDEALELIQRLEAQGLNYSVGLAQINKANFNKYLPNDFFNTCSNIRAGAEILKACFEYYGDWQKAYSCYYSGNDKTGFKDGYVAKVEKALMQPILTLEDLIVKGDATQAIEFYPINKDKNEQYSLSLRQRRLNASLSFFNLNKELL